jgi:hypothetical protein
MKCVCGYDDSKVEYKEDCHGFTVASDLLPFQIVEVKMEYSIGWKYWQEVYLCPKCGTLKIDKE